MTIDDLEVFTIEMALDYIEEFIKFNSSVNNGKTTRRATQEDFDKF